jgi:hypothetical protein
LNADPHTTCPRCGGGFACGAAGPGPCACQGVSLDAERLAELRGRYTGCLCLACLANLAAEPPDLPAVTGALPPG